MSENTQTGFDITQTMDTLFYERYQDLKSYYCREDFVAALNAYDGATPDSKKFKRKELEFLCKARGINVKDLISDRTNVLARIPTRNQLQKNLLKGFYDMCQSAPTPAAYMERTVRRLAPQYARDTVRAAILKKFVAGSDEDFKTFDMKGIYAWAKRHFSEDEAAEFESADADKKKRLVISKIDDSVFDADVKLTNAEILTLISRKVGDYIKDIDSFEGIILSVSTRKHLAELLNEYDISTNALSDTALISALVEAVNSGKIPSETIESKSSLVSSIEKDFRKQLSTTVKISSTGEEISCRDYYKDAKKYALRAKKKAANTTGIDANLLELCNDLSLGRLRRSRETKRDIYLFAICFGMKVLIRGRADAYDEARNMEKNLLEEYYNDNLLRYISEETESPGREFDKEPTGEGINYKNFAEAIYIYFLMRDDLGLTPGQKIDEAEKIIRECMNRADENDVSARKKGTHTEEYINDIVILLSKDREEIADYVLKKYQVAGPRNTDDHIAPTGIAAEENTASDRIDDIMYDIGVNYDDVEVFEVNHRSDMEGEVNADINFRTNFKFDWKIRELLEQEYGGDARFMRILSELDTRVHIVKGRFNRNSRRIMLTLLNALSINSAPCSADRLTGYLNDKGVAFADRQLSESMKTLKSIGYDIRRGGGANNDGYYLAERENLDEDLKALLKRVSDRYFRADDDTDYMLSETLAKRLGVDRKISRCNMIALHLSYYISTLGDLLPDYSKGEGREIEGELSTFPEVFDDYANGVDGINDYLEEARYQPISAQNVFDMYVITALYFYLIENNGYMEEVAWKKQEEII